MGYAKEKEKVEEKIKRLKRVLLGVVVLIIVALCAFSAFYPPVTWKYYFSLPKIDKRAEGELRMHFLDVGQGDCTIVELPDGKILMIDGGNGQSQTTATIMRYLNALQADEIDYLLVTHADSDHCGALDTVLTHTNVKRAFLPVAVGTDNGNADREYAEFYDVLTKKGVEWEYSSRAIQLNGEEKSPYALSFLYPYTANLSAGKEDNERSAVVWLDYVGVSALFTGDAPFAVEEELMRDFALGMFKNRGADLTDTEILKVSHHGSKYATSEEFIRFLGIETAVISCGERNQYGHPSDEVLQTLSAVNAKTYRTDTQGHVVITVSPEGTYCTKILGK